MSRAAIRYAKAIIDIATESNNTTAVNNDMKTIGTAIKENGELHEFLSNPIVNGTIKMNALTEISTRDIITALKKANAQDYEISLLNL